MLAASIAACGNSGKVGEACTREGDSAECIEGAVCGSGQGTGFAYACLTVCKEQSDCPATHECNGVANSSIKGCRIKDVKKK